MATPLSDVGQQVMVGHVKFFTWSILLGVEWSITIGWFVVEHKRQVGVQQHVEIVRNKFHALNIIRNSLYI